MEGGLLELEIREIPSLAADQVALLDGHSVLNVLNVLAGELAMLGLLVEDSADAFSSSLRHCRTLAEGLKDPGSSRESVEQAEPLVARIEADVAGFCQRHAKRMNEANVAERLRCALGILGILHIRARELLSRSQSPDQWASYAPSALRGSFSQIFAAMEGFSRGRFRIVQSPFIKGPRDYFIELDFDPRPEQRIWMPAVFLDVMRDLVANARKYTEPGGWIVASLHQDASELRFSVQDSGRGIPSEEIPRVVQFGHRARNVENVRSLGGGFGLTKAFLVTQRFGGRFWIASREGVGTRVRIAIPRPNFARN